MPERKTERRRCTGVPEIVYIPPLPKNHNPVTTRAARLSHGWWADLERFLRTNRVLAVELRGARGVWASTRHGGESAEL